MQEKSICSHDEIRQVILNSAVLSFKITSPQRHDIDTPFLSDLSFYLIDRDHFGKEEFCSSKSRRLVFNYTNRGFSVHQVTSLFNTIFNVKNNFGQNLFKKYIIRLVEFKLIIWIQRHSGCVRQALLTSFQKSVYSFFK